MNYLDKILLIESFSRFPEAREEFMELSGYLQELQQIQLEIIITKPQSEQKAVINKMDSMLVRKQRLAQLINEIKDGAPPEGYTKEQVADYNALVDEFKPMSNEMDSQFARVGFKLKQAQVDLNAIDPDDEVASKCIADAHREIMSKKFGTFGEFSAWASEQACGGLKKAAGFMIWATTNDPDVAKKWTNLFNKANTTGAMIKTLLGYTAMTRAGRTRAIFAGLGTWTGVALAKFLRRARAAKAAVHAGSTAKNIAKANKGKTKKLLKGLEKGFKQGFKEMNPKEYARMKKAGKEGLKKLDDAAKVFARETLEQAAKRGGKELTEEGLKQAMVQGLKVTGKKTGVRVGMAGVRAVTKVLGPFFLIMELFFVAFEVCMIAAPAGQDPSRKDKGFMGVDWGQCATMFTQGIDHAGDSYDKFKERKKEFLAKKKKSKDPNLTMPYEQWDSWPDDMQCSWCSNGAPSDAEGQGPVGSKPMVRSAFWGYQEAAGPDCIEVLSRGNCDGSKEVLKTLKKQAAGKRDEDLKTLQGNVTERGRTGGTWGWKWTHNDVKLAKEHGSFPFPEFYPKTVRFSTYRGGASNDKVWIDFVPYNENTEYMSEMVKLLKDCISDGEAVRYRSEGEVGVIGHFYWDKSGSMLSNRNTNLLLELDGPMDWMMEDKHADIYPPLIRAIFNKWKKQGSCYITNSIQDHFHERGRTQMGGSWRKKNYVEPTPSRVRESFSRNKLINKNGVSYQMSNHDLNKLDKKIFSIINEEINAEINLLNESAGTAKAFALSIAKIGGSFPKNMGKLLANIGARVEDLKAAVNTVENMMDGVNDAAKAVQAGGDAAAGAKQSLQIAGGQVDDAIKLVDGVLEKLKAAPDSRAAQQHLSKVDNLRKELVNYKGALQQLAKTGDDAASVSRMGSAVANVQKRLVTVRKALQKLFAKTDANAKKIAELEAEVAAGGARAAKAEKRIAKLEKALKGVVKEGKKLKKKVKAKNAKQAEIQVQNGVNMDPESFAKLMDTQVALAKGADDAAMAGRQSGKTSGVVDFTNHPANRMIDGGKAAVKWTWDKAKGLKWVLILGVVGTIAAVTYLTMPGEEEEEGGGGKRVSLARCADGKCGKATRGAIKAYQVDRKLMRKTGVIDSITAKKMVSEWSKVMGEGTEPASIGGSRKIAGCKWVDKSALDATDGKFTFKTLFIHTEVMQTFLYKAGFSKEICAFGGGGGGGGGGGAVVKPKKDRESEEKKKKPEPPAKSKTDPNVLKVESARFGKECAKQMKKPRPLMRLTIAELDKDAWQQSLSTTAKEQIRLEQEALSQYERENPNGEASMFRGLDYLVKRFYLYSDGKSDKINGRSWDGIRKLPENEAIAQVEKAIGKPGSPRPGIEANFEGVDMGRDDNLDGLEDQLNAVLATLGSNIKAINDIKAAKGKDRTGGRKEYLVYSVKAEIIDPFTGAPLTPRTGEPATVGPIPIYKTELEDNWNLPRDGATETQIDTSMFAMLMKDANVGLLKSGRLLNPNKCAIWAEALNSIHFGRQEVYNQRDFQLSQIMLHPNSTGNSNEYLSGNNMINRLFAKDECGGPMPKHDGKTQMDSGAPNAKDVQTGVDPAAALANLGKPRGKINLGADTKLNLGGGQGGDK
tara:strand:- start:62662 stop:67527 length:4866 start_codon:yes stop_codon:yes gene_type:complete